jgi:uncharacterized damage-inducible protein DinB
MKILDAVRLQAGMTREVVRMNLADISHPDSLVHPHPAGNCINWVLGHLLNVYNAALPLLGQTRVAPEETLAQYARGSEPLSDADALPFERLTQLWNEAVERFDHGLQALSEDRLSEPAPFSPTDNPNETVGSLVMTVLFHQAYHTGQLGVLRRLVGKPGAVK